MPMADPEFKWITKARNLIEPIMADMEFLQEIERIRRYVSDAKLPLEIRYILMPSFGFPNNSYEFLLHYIHTLEKDFSKIVPPVYVISDLDRTVTPSTHPADDYITLEIEDEMFAVPRLSLLLEPGITRDEFLEFAERMFSKVIEPKLALMRDGVKKPIRAKTNIKRDASIQYLLSEGKKPQQIADYLNKFGHIGAPITPEDVRQISRRYKKPRK